MEAGFPIASEGDFHAVKAVAAAIRRPVIAALARACKADIERAWQALKNAEHPRIHVFLATSDIHLKYKLRSPARSALSRLANQWHLRSHFAMTWNFPRKMPLARIRNFYARCLMQWLRPAQRQSIFRIRLVSRFLQSLPR